MKHTREGLVVLVFNYFINSLTLFNCLFCIVVEVILEKPMFGFRGQAVKILSLVCEFSLLKEPFSMKDYPIKISQTLVRSFFGITC